jgi:hypothetical protein
VDGDKRNQVRSASFARWPRNLCSVIVIFCCLAERPENVCDQSLFETVSNILGRVLVADSQTVGVL